MNILELCLSPGVGGLEMYAAKISKQLSDDDDHNVFAVSKPGTLYDKRVREAGINTIALTTVFRHLPLLAASKLARIIDNKEIDVMHIHWGKDFLLATMAKRMSHRKPRLVYTRQMEITRDKHDWYHTWLYSQLDAYVAITEKLQKAAQKWLPMPAENVKLLYYGVPEPEKITDEYRSQFLQQNGLREEAFKVGLIGRIEHVKGQHVLLEAVKQLTETGHDVQAMIIGPAMDDDYLQQLMQKASDYGLDDRFRRIGFVDNPQAVMQCFDAITLLTKAETFGLVLVEAMRAGVAVIGTDAGGVPEIIKDRETGLLVGPHDSQQLADVIRQYKGNSSEYEEIRRKGKKFADSMFSEENHLSSLLNIFNKQ